MVDNHLINEAQWFSFLTKEISHQERCGKKKTYVNNFLEKKCENIFCQKFLKEHFQTAGIYIIFLDMYGYIFIFLN